MTNATSDAVTFFNAVVEDGSLQRYPNNIRKVFKNKGLQVSRSSSASEIRFCTDATKVLLHCSVDNPVRMHVYFGNHYGFTRIMNPQKKDYMISPLDNWKIGKNNLPYEGFHPSVVRIVFDSTIGPKGFQQVTFKRLEHDGTYLRQPLADEIPKKTILFYGSSITHGTKSTSIIQSYPFLIGQHVHMNVLNKAMAGSCLMEPEVSEYLASLSFDYAVLELGVNARRSLSYIEFESRVRYLLKRIQKTHPNVPIFLITIYPNVADFVRLDDLSTKQEDFRDVLRRIGTKTNHNVHLIEGDTLLDIDGLSADLIHPSNVGYEQIASRLIRYARKRLRGE